MGLRELCRYFMLRRVSIILVVKEVRRFKMRFFDVLFLVFFRVLSREVIIFFLGMIDNIIYFDILFFEDVISMFFLLRVVLMMLVFFFFRVLERVEYDGFLKMLSFLMRLLFGCIMMVLFELIMNE